MRFFALILAMGAATGSAFAAETWTQFRGPNATGVSAGTAKLPDEIGPDKNVVWKVPFSVGHSSPVIADGRIYLTGAKDNALLTFAIDAATGKTLWTAEAPHKGLEKYHSIGSAAQPTSATDGQVVASFFGSCGLFGYDRDGKQLWSLPMGPFRNDFGAGSSPILVGNRVILNQDHDTDSFLMAIDKKSGKVLWKTERPDVVRGYATPVIWDINGKKQIVVVGTLRVAGYDLDTGKELWTVRGLSRVVTPTPVIGPDNVLYLAGWASGGDDADRFKIEPFADFIKAHDKNANGTLEYEEVPDDSPFRQRFVQVDRDKDDHITKEEYETMRRIFDTGKNALVAIKPGGKGDVTATHVIWEQRRYLPFVPSVLFYKDTLFTVKGGGIVTSLDPSTGQPITSERVPGPGEYYASPVAGDGKVYLANQRGDVCVISGEGEWKLLSRTKMGEDVFATPAIVGGRIYFRTAGHLYCFGLPSDK